MVILETQLHSRFPQFFFFFFAFIFMVVTAYGDMENNGHEMEKKRKKRRRKNGKVNLGTKSVYLRCHQADNGLDKVTIRYGT